MADKNETKIFLKTLNAISSCYNIQQVMFMVRWTDVAYKNGKITDERFLRMIKIMINIKRKQM